MYAANAGAEPQRANKLTDETKGPVRQRRDFQREDEATVTAAVGWLRAGGTTIGTSSPPECPTEAKAFRSWSMRTL